MRKNLCISICLLACSLSTPACAHAHTQEQLEDKGVLSLSQHLFHNGCLIIDKMIPPFRQGEMEQKMKITFYTGSFF